MNKRRPGSKFTMEKPKKYKQMMVAKTLDPQTAKDKKGGQNFTSQEKNRNIQPVLQKSGQKFCSQNFKKQKLPSGVHKQQQQKCGVSEDEGGPNNQVSNQGSIIDQRSDTFGSETKAQDTKDAVSSCDGDYNNMSQESTSSTLNGKFAKNLKSKQQIFNNKRNSKQSSKVIKQSDQKNDIKSQICQADQCQEIISNLRNSPEQKSLFDFGLKIQKIGMKIIQRQITNTEKFAMEMRVILSNLLQQNLQNPKVYPIAMATLSKFEQLFAEVTPAIPFFKKELQKPVKKVLIQQQIPLVAKAPAVKKQAPQKDPPLTADEVQQLASNIRNLNRDQLMGILQIMKTIQPKDQKDKQLQFDVGQIPLNKQRELQEYVKKCQVTTKPSLQAMQVQSQALQMQQQQLMQNMQIMQNQQKQPVVRQQRSSSKSKKKKKSKRESESRPSGGVKPSGQQKITSCGNKSSSSGSDSGSQQSETRGSGSQSSSSSSSDDENFKKLSRLKKK